jgi:hypothetical protein
VDTLEFLKTILPEHGIHYLALFKEGYRFPAHKAYTDLETMAYAIDQMAKSQQVSVYHACASYQKAVIELDELDKNGNHKRKYRIPENWDRARTFWVDLDCGQEKFDKGDGYLTKRDAVVAIRDFSKTVSWPMPMIVDSGNGVHAYWPLTKDIKSSAWCKVANILKASLAHAGVLADPTRTADFASILRPAGSVNRKNGDAKPVLVKMVGTPADPKDLAATLTEYAVVNGVKLLKEHVRRAAPVANDLNSDLTAHLTQYPEVPIDANVMADKCAQVAIMRDTKGDVSYDHWWKVIGLLTYCEDGRELAQDWTSERAAHGHNQLDWDIKYDTWNAGPTLCETLDGCRPGGCEGCPMKGKVSSPLQLGRVIPISEETVEEVVTEEGATEQATIPALPYGYQWDGRLLCRMLPDKDGVLQPLAFCENLFYPTSRIRGEDGTFRYGIRFHLPDKRIRDFEIAGESVASATDLLRAFARYELTKSNHKESGNHMTAYLLDQLQALKQRITETNTLTSFGWKENHKAFLLGDDLYAKDETRKVLVGGNAKERANTFANTKGSLEKYATALNFIYDRPGALHWQYAICAGWGSLLSHYCEDLYKGLILALQGGDTARGKTTVCHAALAAFGNPAKLTLNSKDGFTTNALWATLGVFNNVPVLVDELTSVDPQTFSDITYGVSNGQDRIRMVSKSGGVVFAKSSEWRLNVYVTGNKDFHGLLATNQANSQAEAVRLVQLSVDRYPPLMLVNREDYPEGKEGNDAWGAASALVAAEAIKKMSASAGHAGVAMVKYILENEAAVSKMMQEVLGDFTRELPSPKYRFYRAHSACTIVIARIAKELGIISFDVDAMYRFTVKLINDLAESVMETNTVTADDAFNRMVNHLNPRIIVTTEFRDKRDGRGPESPRTRVMGDVAGRYVLGTQSHKEMTGHLMLSQKEVREWCMKNRIDYHAMMANLQKEGALLKQGEKITLTRGTDVPMVQQRCIIIDTQKLDKDAALPSLTLVADEIDDMAVGDV